MGGIVRQTRRDESRHSRHECLRHDPQKVGAYWDPPHNKCCIANIGKTQRQVRYGCCHSMSAMRSARTASVAQSFFGSGVASGLPA
jgi:hypothetical protein